MKSLNLFALAFCLVVGGPVFSADCFSPGSGMISSAVKTFYDNDVGKNLEDKVVTFGPAHFQSEFGLSDYRLPEIDSNTLPVFWRGMDYGSFVNSERTSCEDVFYWHLVGDQNSWSFGPMLRSEYPSPFRFGSLETKTFGIFFGRRFGHQTRF